MRHKIKYITFLALALTAMVSCKSYLEEEPKSVLTASYLSTAGGVNAALVSCYSDLRLLYGQEVGLVATCSGTDEWQKGPDGSVNFNTYSSSMGADASISGMWNWGYASILTENAVIKYAPTASGLLENDRKSIIAEAKYIRATWYFAIVQTFGSCPLHLELTTAPTTTDSRDSSQLVYQAIVKDLEEAKLDLPNTTTNPGRVTAAAAYHLLSKVYLTRATQPFAEATDYQKAYDNAMKLINNAGTYNLALLPDYASVFTIGQEHNQEVIFTVERNTSTVYNDGDQNLAKSNKSSFFFRPNYSAWVPASLARTIEYGRPWHRQRPTNFLLNVIFADRTNDTRYDKTFQTVWCVNNPTRTNDTAAWLPGSETLPHSTRALVVYKPSQYYGNVMADGTTATASIFPSLSKYDDNQRPTVADASVRSFIVHRFSETYLIAAEAAMYLNNATESVRLLNVVRTRAAYLASRSAGANSTAVSALLAKTPSMTDKDAGITFILDERSRELAGEYMRFWDLCRTRTVSGQVQLLNRINNLSPACPATGLVRAFHVLRPIPQGQRDATSNYFRQNPGY